MMRLFDLTGHCGKLLALTALGLVAFAPSAQALTFDTTVRSFDLGTGISNAHWTTNAAGGVEVGLRVHNRFTGDVIPQAGTGTYIVATGTSDTPTRTWDNNAAIWNFDFSVDFGAGNNGSAFNTYLDMDYNPLLGATAFSTLNLNAFVTDFNASHIPDPDPSLLQDSTNIGFDDKMNANAGFGLGFDPFAEGAYTFRLRVYSRDQTGGDGQLITSTEILARTQDAPVVPEPASLALLSMGLAGAGWISRRRKA